MQGRNVDEIVQEAISIVFTNSWLYAIEVSGGTVHFDKQQRQEIEEMIGQSLFTGAELAKWVKEIHRQATTPPPLPEPVEPRAEKKESKTKAVVRQKLDELHAKVVQSAVQA